jgi:hypothetical protein
MPLLDNPKHEIYAQELAKGTTATRAYVRAGYRESRPAASRLSTNVNIQGRVAELQAVTAERAEITIESLLREAEKIWLAAMASGQCSAAVSALILKAKLAGLWGKKRDNTNKNSARELTDGEIATRLAELRGDRNVDPNSLSDEQLANIIARAGEGPC